MRPTQSLTNKFAPLFSLCTFGWTAHAAPTYTADDYRRAVNKCWQVNDMECAEQNWTYYLRLRPNDTKAMASLGAVMNMRDNHKGAVLQFEKVIAMGEGSYDLFGYYADSLTHLGRTDEAIDWSYKSLSIMPQMLDVRGNLAKLLLVKKRYYEALSLLESYDDRMVAEGNSPYFMGQRISIETAIAHSGSLPMVEDKSLRLPKYKDYYYAPVTVGQAKPQAFIVDTGATQTAMSEEFLSRTQAQYKVLKPHVFIKVANGQRSDARLVSVEVLKVGPFEVKNAPVLVCHDCMPLLGQSVLSKFDFATTKNQGVEFLTIAPRAR